MKSEELGARTSQVLNKLGLLPGKPEEYGRADMPTISFEHLEARSVRRSHETVSGVREWSRYG